MRFRICNALICVSLVLVLAGCPKANTCSIRTDAIYCVFAIEIQSGVVTARAKLNVGNPFGTVLTVDPSCGDQVTANGVVLTPTIPLALFGHTAAIPSAPEYEFVLTRQGEEPYRYTIAPPPLVNILSPRPMETIPASQETLDILWENNAPESSQMSFSVDVSANGNQISTQSLTVPDTGQFTLQGPFPEGATVSVTLSRSTGAWLPASELQGSISATSSAGTWITVVAP